MKNIEVEVRSFVTEEKYNSLLEWFKENSTFVNDDTQVTYYFDCAEDLRIQQSKEFSKIWMKKGKIHDDHREEIEIKFDREKFDELEKLFLSLGYNVEIKWFRTRHRFDWKGVKVAIDFTKGYGHIIELEKMSTEEDKDVVLGELKEKLASLGVSLTPKEEFGKKYEFYKANWQKLT